MKFSLLRMISGAVREALEAAGVPLLEAQVAMIPQTTVELTDEKSLKDIQRDP